MRVYTHTRSLICTGPGTHPHKAQVAGHSVADTRTHSHRHTGGKAHGDTRFLAPPPTTHNTQLGRHACARRHADTGMSTQTHTHTERAGTEEETQHAHTHTDRQAHAQAYIMAWARTHAARTHTTHAHPPHRTLPATTPDTRSHTLHTPHT